MLAYISRQALRLRKIKEPSRVSGYTKPTTVLQSPQSHKTIRCSPQGPKITCVKVKEKDANIELEGIRLRSQGLAEVRSFSLLSCATALTHRRRMVSYRRVRLAEFG